MTPHFNFIELWSNFSCINRLGAIGFAAIAKLALWNQKMKLRIMSQVPTCALVEVLTVMDAAAVVICMHL
jgi:hypothetical protein